MQNVKCKMQNGGRGRHDLLFVVLALVLASCTSPEAHRTRGGGAGADVGNRDAAVEMHAGSQPYYQTPCRGPKEQCEF